MVSTWSSESGIRWNLNENPEQINGQFTFVDFIPECQDEGGIFTAPKFVNFRALVDRGNDWLRANPSWKVITCESVEFKRGRKNQDFTEKMTYMEYSETVTRYVRALRLWIEKRSPGEEREQQIGYLNIIPEIEKEGGLFTTSVFEKLNVSISRFNNLIQSRPIPGRIITVETQEMKASSRASIDPDKSSWMENGNVGIMYVIIIRVFYELSDGLPEQIGIWDFVPDVLEKRGIFSVPKYEPFPNVVKKASDWCIRQSGIRVCNMQSFEMKVNLGKDIDPQKMSYTEFSGRRTFYVRILRVAFTKIPYSNVSTPLRGFTCKTFIPVQVTSGILSSSFESLLETKHRVSEWLRLTGAQVVSAETATMLMYLGQDAKHGNEATSRFHDSERTEQYMFIIRLYINGSYQEPPPEMLPPEPVFEQSCCSIF